MLIHNLKGEHIKTISSDKYNDVCMHAGLVYAAPYNDQAIHGYDPSTWERIRIITACPSGYLYSHTLRVTNCGIALACSYNHCIHMLDDSCSLQHTHGGTGVVKGEFNGPRLCSIESDGSMLVADLFNDRLQVFHDGKWSILPLQPQPSRPVGAVVTQHALYVIARGKLIMYKVQ